VTSSQILDEFVCPLVEHFHKSAAEAEQLVQQHAIGTTARLREVAEKMGIRTHEVDFPQVVEGLSLGRYILVAEDSESERKIFTLAHEIGHHRLHQESTCIADKQVEEIEASIFAHWLLHRISHPDDFKEIARRNPETWMMPMLTVVIGVSLLAVGGLRLFEWLSSELSQ
jgi:Zn-dependent peptidase ImmA (M78 family)